MGDVERFGHRLRIIPAARTPLDRRNCSPCRHQPHAGAGAPIIQAVAPCKGSRRRPMAARAELLLQPHDAVLFGVPSAA